MTKSRVVATATASMVFGFLVGQAHMLRVGLVDLNFIVAIEGR